MTTTLSDATSSFDARILIVEDERLVAEELHDRLTSLGATVVGATASGLQAIEAANVLRPDLVVMDIRLKGAMDGIEAATRITDGQGIPVVFLTAHSDDATLERAKQAQPYGYLLKPLQEHELRVTLSLALHRCRLERQLRNSEQRFLTTLSSIGDAVIATDTDGRVTFLNGVAEALTGWTDRAAQRLPLDDVFRVVGEDGAAPAPSPAATVLAGGVAVACSAPVLLTTRSGATRLIEHSAAPIADRDLVQGAVIVFRDVTHRRAQEDAARQAEARLREAQKLEAVGRLAGGVAHDVNNMMTVVTGYADLLLDQLDADDPNRGLVQELRQAGDRTAGITRRLVSLSRHHVARPQVADVSDLLASIDGTIHHVLPRSVVLRRVTHGSTPRIRVDAGQFEQVVLNLVLNARDAMPHGGAVTIETNVASLDDGWPDDGDVHLPAGTYALVTVTDTGAGIAPELSERIFEPFFSTKADGYGVGLGLSVVREMMRAAGGEVRLYSEPGHGSSFTLYFPALPDVAERAPALAEADGEGLTAERPTLVLLAEDEDAVRGLTRTLLEQHGYTVLAACDGEQALDLAAGCAAPIDLLVTDVMMPRLGGRELAQRLGVLRPETRALFMSGYTADTVLRQGIMHGDVAFLQKPFEGRHFLSAVRSALVRP